MVDQKENNNEYQYPTMEFSDFLENSPPYHQVMVSNLWYLSRSGISESYNLKKPDLRLMCEYDSCNGIRFFEYNDSTGYINKTDKRNEIFIEYKCKNCEITLKSFSILIFKIFKDGFGFVVKLGEWPPYGPKTPTRLLSILGSDKDLFLQGRRAEFHGLGLGAFTYYRRVVENIKNSLFDEIIKVAQKIEPTNKKMVEDLKTAKGNFQFKSSVSEIKLAIPQVLLIEGENPLTLLHGALSTGIHDKTDSECLEYAKSIRHVLAELAERIGIALKQKEELTESVKKLAEVKSKKSSNKQE